MGLLDKIFRRGDDDGPAGPIAVDVEARREQLRTLEQSLDELTRLMREHDDLMRNPGWRAKLSEYDLVASEAMQLRKGTPTRETITDIAFQVRPALTGAARDGAGVEDLVAQQQRALDAAQALVDPLPSEQA